MWSWFKSFVAKLFAQARPGLEQFIKDNLPTAKALLLQLASEHLDKSYHDYKPIAHAIIKSRFPFVPDNHISMALDWAHEHIKGAIDAAKSSEQPA